MVDMSNARLLYHRRLLSHGCHLSHQGLVKYWCLRHGRLVRHEKILRLWRFIDDGIMQRHMGHVFVRKRLGLLYVRRVGRRHIWLVFSRVHNECLGR